MQHPCCDICSIYLMIYILGVTWGYDQHPSSVEPEMYGYKEKQRKEKAQLHMRTLVHRSK